MISEIQRFRRGVWFSLAFVFLLWTIQAFELAFSIDLHEFGILPRTLKGTIGIITGPLVHGDFFHLVSNTFPLVILGVGIFYFYHRIALEVIILIYLMTGFWVWVVAREAYHIGASGIVYGLLSFLFFSGLLRRDSKTLAVSLILLFVYGGNMIYGVFPVIKGISWESHLMGGLSGLFCAIMYRSSKSSVESDAAPIEIDTEEKNSQSEENDKVVYHYPGKIENSNKSGTYNYLVDKDDLI